MEKIIINDINVKDYKISPTTIYSVDRFTIHEKAVKRLLAIYGDDIITEIIDWGISRINGIPYTVIKISPLTCSNFVPFCCVLLYNNFNYYDVMTPKKLLDESIFYIPKKRNSVLDCGIPIINWNTCFEVREVILRKYFPKLIKDIEFFINDPNDYKTDEEYCIALDESYNMLTGSTGGIPKPEPDIDFLKGNIRNLF